jgi:hypothetical protein
MARYRGRQGRSTRHSVQTLGLNQANGLLAKLSELEALFTTRRLTGEPVDESMRRKVLAVYDRVSPFMSSRKRSEMKAQMREIGIDF